MALDKLVDIAPHPPFNFSVDTMVDNQSSRLVQIVSNLATHKGRVGVKDWKWKEGIWK
ncbi:MAG: hypothetical protein LVT47_08275 [Cyanobacteria bacterium LVE1205-1]|jgi:hypothetical protein